MTLGSVSILDPLAFGCALALTAVGAAWLMLRRRRFSAWTIGLLVLALILLAFAAGNIELTLPRAGRIAVLVDLSPSTRGAPWRNPAWLKHRLSTLLPRQPYQTFAFADGALREWRPELGEITCAETRLPEVAADAIVLFSDGLFALPQHSAAVYPVLTEWSPLDVRVDRLEYRGERSEAAVAGDDLPRRLTWSSSGRSVSVRAGGSRTLGSPGELPAGRVDVRLDSADLWPENDWMTLPPLAPKRLERWWVGDGAPAGFTTLSAAQLPVDLAGYLPAGLIVLAEPSAESVSSNVQLQLNRYVSDLGGSLILLAGGTDYAAWRNTPLLRLLPLSPDPPRPETRWTILVDNSGSMAEAVGNRSRWELAAAAGEQMIGGLPAGDTVSVAAFSDSARWVITSATVRDALAKPVDLANQSPRGPTNLEAILRQLAASGRPGAQQSILVITDAQVQFDDLAGTLRQLKGAGFRVSILALRDGPADAALRELCSATGGVYLRQADPAKWTQTARELGMASAPARLQHSPLQAAAKPPLAAGDRSTRVWSRAWEKQGGDVLVTAQRDRESIPLVARWQAGLGSAAVAVMPLSARDRQALCDDMVRRPADPRFQMDTSAAADGLLAVQASNAGRAMNGLRLTLPLVPMEGNASPLMVPLIQEGPGEYVAQWSPFAQGVYGTVREGNRAIDTVSLAGMYPREFRRIGVDQVALEKLAESTGGRTIATSDKQPLRFAEPMAPHRVAQPLVVIAGGLVMAAAVLFRRQR